MMKEAPEKDTLDNEALKAFLIEKEELDEELWKKIKTKTEGTSREKQSAISLIFDNYPKVPSDADEILIEFASNEQPLSVRKKLATQISKDEVSLPGGIYLKILNKLSRDPDEPIKTQISHLKKKFLEPLFDLAKFVNLLLELEQKTIFKEFEFNWLTFLPVDQMLNLLNLHKEGKDEEIKQMLIRVSQDRSYLDKFKKDISGIQLITHRMPILTKALDAHADKKYELSIPCLLAQIEGILWDIAVDNHIAFGTRIITRRGRTTDSKGAYNLVAHTQMYNLMSDTLADFFLDKIYTQSYRHWILHGRKTDYANADGSMKLVMLLRAICNVAKK